MDLRKVWVIGGAVFVLILVGVLARFVLMNETGEPVSEMATPSPTLAVSPTIVPSDTAVSTLAGETDTPTPATPTLTPLSQLATATTTPTLPPSETPVSAANVSSPSTPTPLPCNLAAAGNPLDVTVPDGATFSPGEAFVKTWRIINGGSCTWTPQYALIWVSGEQMSQLTQVNWDFNVAPGEMLEVSIQMKAPSTPGSYQSGWLLRSPNGERFGIGAGGGAALVTRIQVVATPTPSTGSISGRVVLNGAPASGVNLTLEDRGNLTIASAQSGADGSFTLSNLPVYQDGYNLVFSQEVNQQFALDQVVSWAWLGRIPVGAGVSVVLTDFEIGLAGLSLLNPAPDSSYSVSSITPGNPLLFDFSSYPGATSYWVDISRGEEKSWVWQSPLVGGPPVTFEGMLFGGAPMQPGDYWWAVGVQKPLGAYTQTVYSYLVGFGVEP